MKIKAINKDGTYKIYEVSNPIQVAAIAYKYDCWEYVL